MESGGGQKRSQARKTAVGRESRNMGEILLIVSLGYLYLRAVTTNGGA